MFLQQSDRQDGLPIFDAFLGARYLYSKICWCILAFSSSDSVNILANYILILTSLLPPFVIRYLLFMIDKYLCPQQDVCVILLSRFH